MYHQRKTVTILDLPPTSHAARGHILRAFYATYTQKNCLENASLDPLRYGFQRQEGTLEAKAFHRLLPDHMAIDCRCAKCATSRCPCREEGLPCCAFCKCQTNEEPCRNPNGVVHASWTNMYSTFMTNFNCMKCATSRSSIICSLTLALGIMIVYFWVYFNMFTKVSKDKAVMLTLS